MFYPFKYRLNFDTMNSQETFSDEDWLDTFVNRDRTRMTAETSLRTFDQFCQKQIGKNGESKDIMINKYKTWFEPSKVKDQTHGFFRRWMIIKWRRNFENDPERDEHLKDKLRDNQEEKSLVFSTLIHLSRLLLKNGKFSHSKDSKDTQKEWNTNSDPLNDFVETCIIDSDGNKNVRDTYRFYRQMMEARQETALGMAQFGKMFKEYFDQQVTKEGGKSERVWLNIDFVIPKVTDYDDS